jgi:rod shape-determining protein MreD
MTLLLAAVGATVTALLELSVGPYLRVGTTGPDLVLVVGIVVTLAIGIEAGLAWAFVGGLVLDVLAQRPLGSTAFALLLCVGATGLLGRGSARFRQIVTIPAAFVLSVVYSMTLFFAFNALAAPIPVADPLARVLPSAVVNLVLAALIGPLAIAIHDRRMDVERVDW